jgi:hypothetical protein
LTAGSSTPCGMGGGRREPGSRAEWRAESARGRRHLDAAGPDGAPPGSPAGWSPGWSTWALTLAKMEGRGKYGAWWRGTRRAWCRGKCGAGWEVKM